MREKLNKEFWKEMQRTKLQHYFLKKLSIWVKISKSLFYTTLKIIWEQGTCIMCHITGQTVQIFFLNLPV